MKRLRVLYLTHYAELYGANRSLLDLVREGRDAGAVEPFVVLAYDGPLRTELERAGIAHAIVPFVPWMHKRVLMGRPHHRLLQRMRYRRQARERERTNRIQQAVIEGLALQHRAHVIHSNSAVIGVGAAVAGRLGLPHVWHIRELPFLHYGFSVDGGVRRYAEALRKANAIIALSQAVVDDMRTFAPAAERVAVIPNGVVSEQDLKERRQGGTTRWEHLEDFNFLLAGLFHPAKGQEEAVQAFALVHAQNPRTALYLAGDGRTEKVRAAVEALGISSAVHFIGFVPDLGPVLEKTHALLQCSRHEALGRIVLEAKVAGVPIIGHASGATPELIEHERNGLLYTTTDELVERMSALVGDPDLARRLGEAGRTEVPGRYTIEAMTDAVLATYQRVIAP
jgi:glycosyltransferase involved in cell wall biosynthesis